MSDKTDVAAELLTLARGIRRCRKCPLHEERTRAVPGEGAAPARIMLVGEAPGRKEDETGRPFIGQAGAYLDSLFEARGLSRDEMFVTSAVKCRPPKNRPPHIGELDTCREAWLDRQLALVDPEIVVLMGQAAIRQVLGETARMNDVHGQTRRLDGRVYLMTYHPAAGMRFPHAATHIAEDFDLLAELSEG